MLDGWCWVCECMQFERSTTDGETRAVQRSVGFNANFCICTLYIIQSLHKRSERALAMRFPFCMLIGPPWQALYSIHTAFIETAYTHSLSIKSYAFWLPLVVSPSFTAYFAIGLVLHIQRWAEKLQCNNKRLAQIIKVKKSESKAEQVIRRCRLQLKALCVSVLVMFVLVNTRTNAIQFLFYCHFMIFLEPW